MPEKKLHTLCESHFFDLFFRKHVEDLRNFLFYKFGNLDTAADLAQEAFVKLWDNCDKVDTDRAKNYLFTIGVNLGISQKRHEQVKFKYQEIKIHSKEDRTHESPEFILEEKQFEAKLMKCIAELPDRQREVFLLHRMEKKTYKEIAEMSQVSVKAIEKLMTKALKKLRENIDQL